MLLLFIAIHTHQESWVRARSLPQSWVCRIRLTSVREISNDSAVEGDFVPSRLHYIVIVIVISGALHDTAWDSAHRPSTFSFILHGT